MEEYFKLIRRVLGENRYKGGELYYEAHHIIPKSFGKRSNTVLLTPEEHFLAHKYLADFWKEHTVYGRKMLWAFHRLAYDGNRVLTEAEYGESRRILVGLWKHPKSKSHKKKIGLALKGNSNNKSRVFKGMKSDMSLKGRESVAESQKKLLTGKTGKEARAARGPYTVEFEDGRKITKGSYPELVKATGLKYGILQSRNSSGNHRFINGWKIYSGC